MNRDDIIRMAREAGAFPELSETPEKDLVFLMRFAERAIRAAIEQYDQTSLELCGECGWKAIIPGDGCLVCARQKAKPVAQWVELTDDEARALVNRATFGDKTNWQALVYMVDAKLKEKNAA